MNIHDPLGDAFDVKRVELQLPVFHPDQVLAYRTEGRFLALRAGRRWGKALALSTPIPTPSGWTTMGRLGDGDEVFDEIGNICRVTKAWPVMFGRPCNEVEFSDGTIVVADDEHRWLTTTHADRRNSERTGGARRHQAKVRTTKQIADTLTHSRRGDRNHAVKSCQPIQCPAGIFSVPPYVLGAWLGDGSTATAQLATDDEEIIHNIRMEGQPANKIKAKFMWTLGRKMGEFVRGEQPLVSRLRQIGVLNNKHIPSDYLRASMLQRLALLQGLMDTDGYICDSGHCEFTSISERLAHGVLELTRSLGIRSYLFIGRATLKGRDCGPKYRVKFTTSFPVFRLRRKAERLEKRRARFNMEQRMIVDVRPIKSVPVRCITVDSPSNLYLCSESFIPTHNTAFDVMLTISCAMGAGGRVPGNVGWFAPENKKLSEAYNDIVEIVEPIKASSSKNDGVIKLMTGGRIDFWSLEDEHAGRSRQYDLAILDEAAFGKTTLTGTWEKSIKPTLFDTGGQCIVSSNTNGIDPDNFFYQICHEPRFGFVQFHAPTRNNPYLPKRDPSDTDEQHAAKRAAALAELIANNPPLVYSQEYEAEFVDWSGASFFTRASLLSDGKPVQLPSRVECVFAIIDTATKTGKQHDGTAITFFAMTSDTRHPLVILDWDTIQIEGASLETWLPQQFIVLEEYAKRCHARMGSLGAYIEDKASGMVLLQHAANGGWPAQPIDSKLTSLGKDERAISVSGYVYTNKVVMTAHAYDKVTTFKGSTRNHLIGQVTDFRVGAKESSTRNDDLLDTFTYGVAIALGNQEGF